MKATRAFNLIIILGGTVAVAILQDCIAKEMPSQSEVTQLQSWMTFFTLVFSYLGMTEVFDDSMLLIFKPKLFELKLENARRQRAAQENGHQVNLRHAYNNDALPKENSCTYDVIFCGGLRRCLF